MIRPLMSQALRTLTPSAWGIIAVCALLALIIGLWSVQGYRAEQARQQAAQSAAEARAAQAGQTLARDALDQSEASVEREAVITDQTRSNRDAILSAPDAGNPAGDTGRTGLERLCQRPAYRDDPACR